MTRGSPRLYFETVRRLHAEQVWHQVLLRFGRLVPAPGAVRLPANLPQTARWGPCVPRCRMPQTGDVVAGRFRYWNLERQLDLGQPWVAPDLGRSWNYMVHYFDALPALAVAGGDDPERLRAIAAFVERWIAVHPPGTLPAWEPYPTALRLVQWIDALHVLRATADPGWQARVLASVHVQADWLHRRLERHLLGTHLLKDVKALLVAASVFDTAAARRWRRTALPLLRRELQRHVGRDGVHVEPSLMYHCTALEDVLDLLNFDGALDVAAADELARVAQRMLDAAIATATPTGESPLLGDAWRDGAPSPQALGDYAARLGVATPAPPASGARYFADAGILTWRDTNWFVLADVGGIGPPHLSGHGHCDSLSFELWCDDLPFVVDSGTFTYEAGERRHACRATRAHNTLEIDGQEQHEIWAAFRVARRSRVGVDAVTETRLEATLVPWFDKRLRVQRRFECAEGQLRILDRVEGPGIHRVVSRLHLHPQCRVEPAAEGWIVHHGRVRLSLAWCQAGTVEAGERAEWVPADTSGSYFATLAGEMQPNAVMQLAHAGRLPFTSMLVLRRLDPL